MNVVAYITTRNYEADADHLNRQGLHVTVETDPDGTPFLALTVPNGHLCGLCYVNPGDAIVWNADHKPFSPTVVPEPLVSAIKRYIQSTQKKSRR